MTGERHSNWRVAAFSAPCIPLAAMLLPVSVYLPNYYSRDLGVSLSGVAWAFATVRLFDLFFDPALGLLMDRTNTRFGRFRPFVVLGAPITLIAIYMLFMAQPGISPGYILAWLIVAFVGQSTTQLGHMSWAAQAAAEYHERSRIYGWWQAFTVTGMLLILTLPVIVARLGGSDVEGIQAMGWFVIATMPIGIALALFAMPEPPVRAAHAVVRLGQYWQMIRQINVLRLLGTDILMGTAVAIAASLLFFYFEAVRGFGRAATSQLLLIYFVGALCGAPIWSRLALRIGKHRALMTAAIVYAAAQTSVLIPTSNLISVLVVMFLAGLPFSAGSILLKAMMADVGDEVRLRTGVDQTGMLFSLLTGSIKIGSTVAVFGSFQLLGAAGFEARAGAQNGPDALTALSLTFAVIPATMGLLAAWLISGHGMDSAAHAEIRRELDARDDLEDIQQRLPGGGD
ncbi:MAG: MFS transporter [Caulobacter sp.]|nr:MFS transporter [Caulobacter sp.]